MFAARQTRPFAPLGTGGNQFGSAHCLPFIGREHCDQVLFGDHLRIGEARLVHRANGDQGRAQRWGADHARVKHPGQSDIAAPLRFPRDLGGNARHQVDLPTTLYWLTGFVGGSPSTVRPSNPAIPFHDVGSTFGGRQRLESSDRTAGPEPVSVADTLSASGDDAICNRESSDGNAELFCGPVRAAPGRYRRPLCAVHCSVEKAGGVSTVRRLIRVAHNERDGFCLDAQFFGNDLRIISAHAGADLGAAGAHKNGIVLPDLEPRR